MLLLGSNYTRDLAVIDHTRRTLHLPPEFQDARVLRIARPAGRIGVHCNGTLGPVAGDQIVWRTLRRIYLPLLELRDGMAEGIFVLFFFCHREVSQDLRKAVEEG